MQGRGSVSFCSCLFSLAYDNVEYNLWSFTEAADATMTADVAAFSA